MVRTSLHFVLIAVLAFIFADISISTNDPLQELQLIALGFLTPDFLDVPDVASALVNTVSFALLGVGGAILLGSFLSLFFEYTWVRLFCSFLRSIHELFWAFIFMPLTGLTSLCGILAIAIPYSGVFAKVYAEIRQESSQAPREALPAATSRLVAFCYSTLPVIYEDVKSYTSYRFECALRSSAILGFIGLPTLGYHLETAFREGMYSEASALLYSFYLLILSLKYWTKPKFLWLALLVAVVATSWENSFSLENIKRFFCYDVIPWPMRAAGFYDGSQTVIFAPQETLRWLLDLLQGEALTGAVNTLLLTQVALVLSALLTLLLFPAASSLLYPAIVTRPSRVLLVILRTTPEFILAYIFLQLWGPSMLPAVFALFIHNGAILAHLTSKNVDLIQLPFDSSSKKVNLYFYEILPRCYGQFLAFLFYRWEVIMRESAILGILGVTTLGYYIDSAIAYDHLDKAVILILVTALLNMAIDSLSQYLRKTMRVSIKITSSCAR